MTEKEVLEFIDSVNKKFRRSDEFDEGARDSLKVLKDEIEKNASWKN